jgi:hypothetical protein
MDNIITAFTLAVVSFYVNHRLKKIVDIKININTLFEIYGNLQSVKMYNPSEVVKILDAEILSIEKQHDRNIIIYIQTEKLKQLRYAWYVFEKTHSFNIFSIEFNKINFKKLGGTFVAISFINF